MVKHIQNLPDEIVSKWYLVEPNKSDVLKRVTF